MNTKKNILLGATGSIASIKVHLIAMQLLKENWDVKIIATNNALKFINKEEILKNNIELLTDDDEWDNIKDLQIVHINLRRWADIFIIAPLGANTI